MSDEGKRALADAMQAEIGGAARRFIRDGAVYGDEVALVTAQGALLAGASPNAVREALASTADFVVRPAESDDLNYVRKTWLQVHAQSSSFIDAVGGGAVYFREHAQLRDAAIERGAVTIACRASVPSGICGFAVTESSDHRIAGLNAWHPEGGAPHVHFVYVKPRWRRLGVARLLLAPLAEKSAIYTHRTWMCGCMQHHRPEQCPAPVAIQRLLPLPKVWTFNPYPFLRGSP